MARRRRWRSRGSRMRGEVSGAREHKNVDLSIVAAYCICQKKEEKGEQSEILISRGQKCPVVPRHGSGWHVDWVCDDMIFSRRRLFSPLERETKIRSRSRSAYISLTAADYCRLPRCAVVARGQKRKEKEGRKESCGPAALTSL